MLRSFDESEKCNKTIYDGVHEYCSAEKMNEEQLRASIIKEEAVNKHINICRIIGGLSALLEKPGRIIHWIKQLLLFTVMNPVKKTINK